MNDSRISSYHAKHVVFEEGITEINKINNSFFGDVNSACDVTVPESATSFDATNVSIKLTLYGLDGSWFYGEFGIRENIYLLVLRKIRCILQAVLVHLVQHGHLITGLVNCTLAVLQ